jgi:hypothetical protein
MTNPRSGKGASFAASPSISTLVPRVLDATAAARYLGISVWTLRDWTANGLIEALDLPPLRPREGDRQKGRLRRLLYDVHDLDAFVDRLKAERAGRCERET